MKILCIIIVVLAVLAFALGRTEFAAPVINFLDSIDKRLMLVLNFSGGTALDSFWYAISRKIVWYPLGAVFLFGMAGRSWREYVPVVLCLVLVVVLCDQISSSLFKPYFMRFRPSRCPEICDMLHYVNNYKGGRYGFVSSHAANAIGVTTYVALLFKSRKITLPLLVFSLLVSFSRIYLGVHYPGDVICGSAVGIVSGYVCYHLLLYVRSKAWLNPAGELPVTPLRRNYPNVFAAVVILTLLTVVGYAGVKSLL